MSSPITTHVLDTSLGQPARGLEIVLSRQEGAGWSQIGRGVTNADGRIVDLMKPGSLKAGIYQMMFHTGAYLAQRESGGFYPRVPVIFEITATDQHYHVPLLLNPFGYSTYRGS